MSPSNRNCGRANSVVKHGVTEFLSIFQGTGATFSDLEPDLLVVLDRNGAIKWVNPAFEKATGYTEYESIGRSLSFCISMTDLENMSPRFHFLKKGGGTVKCETVAWRYRNQQHYAIFRCIK